MLERDSDGRFGVPATESPRRGSIFRVPVTNATLSLLPTTTAEVEPSPTRQEFANSRFRVPPSEASRSAPWIFSNFDMSPSCDRCDAIKAAAAAFSNHQDAPRKFKFDFSRSAEQRDASECVRLPFHLFSILILCFQDSATTG
ncbi:hypothetical protein R3P38DRAFT_3167000 [Favolaschia claudopus]|uniref:Uncharacterized protein n=1 Tax=Favolaschia claudopus TaxID=2862362 RepID=A0AAW0EAQ4_9AGAR